MSTLQLVPAEEHRKAPRVKLPAMYTLLRVRLYGAQRYPWTGYIYDLSSSGLRFELDQPLDPGTRVEVRAMLPGPDTCSIRAAGRVVRIHDDDNEPGPVRMAMSFDEFASAYDRRRIEEYVNARLDHHAPARAAA